MKYSFDVKDVSAIDLLGNNYIQLLEENQNKGIHQLVGNAVYVCTNTIEMHEIAKKIFNGEAVDMNENETELFKASIMDSTWHVFIKNAIISAIKNKYKRGRPRDLYKYFPSNPKSILYCKFTKFF